MRMTYLTYSEDLGWDYRAYENYLNVARARMPDDLVNLLSDNRLGIDGDSTLHDSYVHRCAVCFNPLTISSTAIAREMSIELDLVGRFDDRLFQLQYSGVTDVSCERSWTELNELDAHELVLMDDGTYRHVMAYRNSLFIIVSKQVHFTERLLVPDLPP